MVWNAEQDIQLRPAEGTSGVSLTCVPTSAGCFIGAKMKRIPLTQGQFAIVDDKDFKWLNRYKWCAMWAKCTKSFYAARSGKTIGGKRQKTVYMAREILGLASNDKRYSGHIDHNTLNNRISNLRIVTPQQNTWNHKNPKGYSWKKANKKYCASIRVNSKLVYLGLFRTTKEAHIAYLEAKKHYHNIQTQEKK